MFFYPTDRPTLYFCSETTVNIKIRGGGGGVAKGRSGRKIVKEGNGMGYQVCFDARNEMFIF